MPTTPELLNAADPLLNVYAFYSSILIIKMIAMSFMTGLQRVRKKAFISPEDIALGIGGEVKEDPDVERCRRAHLNDLENIPIFIITGLLYVLAQQNKTTGIWLIRVYTACRFSHTFVYALFVIRPPARALMFATGAVINIIMAVMVIIKFLHF